MLKKKDTRKIVSVDLSDDTFIFLAKMAHKKDITFNQLCNDILRDQLNKLEKAKK
jgi:hypothetical protein